MRITYLMFVYVTAIFGLTIGHVIVEFFNQLVLF